MADGPPAQHDERLALAARLFAVGDSAGALEILPGLVADRPDDIAVRLLLARCLQTAGTPAVALAAADAAVACDPTSWQAHALLARAATTIDPERAQLAAERAVALAPHEPEAHQAIAAVRDAAQAPSDTAAATPRRGGLLGGAFGTRAATTPGTRPGGGPGEPTPPPDRLQPRLPAALDPARSPAPPPPEGAPGDAPAPVATATRTPPTTATTQVVPPEVGSAAQSPASGLVVAPEPERPHRLEPRLPAALGGAGPEERPAGAGATDDDRIGSARLALRVVGLLGWLVIGFRIGVQAVGGPLGIGAFVLIVVGVAVAARRITAR